MGTSIGSISLDLIIEKSGFYKQLDSLQKDATKSIDTSFKDAGKSLSKPLDEAVNKTMDTFDKRLEQAENDLDKVVQKALEASKNSESHASGPIKEPEQRKGGRTATAILSDKEKAAAAEMAAATERAREKAAAYAQELASASKPVDLLQAKLDAANGEIETQLSKIRDLVTQSELAQQGKGNYSLDALDGEIEKETEKLRRLQETANATQVKLQRALNQTGSGAAQAVENLTWKTASAGAETKRLGTAMKTAQKNGKKAFGGLAKSASHLGRSIKNAAKSALLISVIYKAFKSLQQYMSKAMSSNKAFANSLNQVKANLSIAFQPILDAIMPALTALMNGLAKATSYIAAFIASLFGKTYQQAAEGAKKLQGETKKAGSEAKKSLASFDELNILSNDKGGDGGGGEAPAVDFSTVVPPDMTWIDTIKEKLGQVGEYIGEKLGGNKALDTLKTAWDRLVVDMQASAGNVKAAVAPIFDELQTSWKRNIPNVEQGISGFVNGTANRVATFTATVGGTTKAATEGAREFVARKEPEIRGLIDRTVTNTTTSFANLGTASENITGTVYGFVTDFFERNSPYISEFCDTVTNAFWNVAQPVVDFFSGVWNDITKAVKEFAENPALKNFLSSINDLLVALQPLWEKLNGVIRVCWDFIGGGLNVALGALRGLLDGIWQFIKNVFIGILETLGSAIDVITCLLNGDWQGAWEAAKECAWNVLKAIINLFASLINIFIKGINGIISGLNKLSIDVPDWVPVFGGQKWGFNIPKIPEIPLLAKGGIVNQPTLSMIGEQGKEAVLPLENNTGWMNTLAQTIAAAISSGQTGGKQEIVIKFASGNMAGLVREMKPYIDAETRYAGVKLVQGVV